MKAIIFMILITVGTLQTFSQNFDNDDNSNVKVTRQGFGRFGGLDMGLGFVNAKGITEGTPYYFEEWNTAGVIYTKNDGRFKVDKVNINLHDNTLEAIYDGDKVFTFDSNNLLRIVIDGKVFRVFEIEGKVRILELLFKDGFSVYKYYSVLYVEKKVNPMLSQNTNKYIRKNKYYVYENKKLVKLKLTKKAFSKQFKSENINEKTILDFIEGNKISIKKEKDFIKALKFVTRKQTI
ncbi:MAG: hypothetical protein HRT67_11980 [Flavobacteriaceae bacterium]|nr:hypothetical protein [Flavobacteriaceae bacterium]